MSGSGATNNVVVHVVHQMMPGGIETLVLDLFRADPHCTRVISLAGQKTDLANSWPALKPIGDALDAMQLTPGLSPSLVPRLAAKLRSFRPTCVFLHHIGPLLYGGLASRLSGTIGLYHVEHDAWHYDNPRHRLLLRLAERLEMPRHIAVSSTVRDRMLELIPAAEIAVVPPGIDLARFKPGSRSEARRRLGLSDEWGIIGTAGRLTPVKGQLNLVEALLHLPDNMHVVIAGEGPERAALLARAQVTGCANRLHLLGHRDDVEEVLPAFDVFCLPSLSEGLPRSVLEAQALDLPVVASRVGALGSAVCPETGTLVEVGDVAGLARAIAGVLQSRAPAGISRAFVERQFSLDGTIAAYRNAAANSKRTGRQ